ncbi:MAG TPA: hypothetical protein VEP66_15320 [Myxococcales bacterium]|nr:hypothetical protein [Myxococcales bacterium]
MRGTFRRDLELAPGPEFRLTRRRSARAFSALLAVAAAGWGVFDFFIGHQVIGIATAVLAVAFVVQLVQAELSGWSFEGAELRSHRLRLPAGEIDGVHVAFSGKTARAWIETRGGEQVALVEGDEQDVRRIADRLSGTLRLASMPARANLN